MKHLILILLCTVVTAQGQSGARFKIVQSAVANGGSTHTSSSRFQLAGTIGQPSTTSPVGTRFSVSGGFWIWQAPTIFAPAISGTNFILSFHSEAGKLYTPQYSESLEGLTWQSLPVIVGDGTVKSLTNTAANTGRRFFRLLEQ